MKFIQTGISRENYLKERVIVKPIERIEDILLNKLDYIIGFVAKEQSEKITDFINNLTKKYHGLVEHEFSKDSSEEYEKIVIKFKNIIQYPELKQASLNYYFYLLQIKESNGLEISEAEIPKKAIMQAWVYPSYYLLQALAETIGREEAIKLYKKYITHYYIDHPPSARGKFVNLQKRFEERTSGDTISSEWVIVHTMLDEGKYAFKNKNCPTLVDSMKDLHDIGFKYLVCCYGDYEKFRATTHDHVVLTMEHTLMKGDPYCSRVLHDTRIDYDLRHPPKEFWDNFEPGKEEDAMKHYRK